MATTFGRALTSAATLGGVEALSNKTLGNSNTVILKDTLFTLQDDADTTKQVQFQLSGLTTATTRTLTVPDASGTVAVLSVANTWTAANVFQSSSGSYSTGGATGTVNIATGATISGSAKTVNIATAGAAGSTTTITIGPTAGAGTITVNAGVSLVTFNQAIKPLVTTVASLPAAGTAGQGAVAFVTDSTLALNGTNLGSNVTGGGANKTPVWSDGTNWKIG